jgi:hypothetical protein
MPQGLLAIHGNAACQYLLDSTSAFHNSPRILSVNQQSEQRRWRAQLSHPGHDVICKSDMMSESSKISSHYLISSRLYHKISRYPLVDVKSCASQSRYGQPMQIPHYASRTRRIRKICCRFNVSWIGRLVDVERCEVARPSKNRFNSIRSFLCRCSIRQPTKDNLKSEAASLRESVFRRLRRKIPDLNRIYSLVDSMSSRWSCSKVQISSIQAQSVHAVGSLLCF